MDASESPLSTSPSPPPSFRSPRHGWEASFSFDDCMLQHSGRAGYHMLQSLSTYVSVSPLVEEISIRPQTSFQTMYSDLSEVERAEVLDRFRQATMRWNSLGRGEEAVGEGDEERKSLVVIVTDACLPLLGSVEAPLCACMLINYELPMKKVSFPFLSTSSWFCNFLSEHIDGIVISMVVEGEVVILKNLEESSGLVIAEMPINVSFISCFV
ncbi:hypothetical protein SASPL_115097 [Salvia splendens]|uniref:Uncharacterized protein n=1 Tax=Salvia splendens TaxID=180675 RepID=A0A8X9A0Z5_SALSN|nr:hypothetical protein SASPL_115097 [Salvia splendens]